MEATAGWNLGKSPSSLGSWLCSWSESNQGFAGRMPDHAWGRSLGGSDWCNGEAVAHNMGSNDGCCRAHLNKLPPEVVVKLVWASGAKV